MPKRTNEFQELVALIHRALGDKGVKITESADGIVPGFGDVREIDVLFETNAGPYKIKIAVEAKDHARPLNVTDIEAIIGKYRAAASIPVDKVVLVSRNGFSKQAIRKAEAASIELRQLSVSKDTDWQNLKPFAKGQTLVLPKLPHIKNINFSPPLPPGLPCGKCQGTIVNKEAGREIDPLNIYVHKVMRTHLLRSRDFNSKTAQMRAAGNTVSLKFDMKRFSLRVAGQDFDLESIELELYWKDKSAPLEFTSYDFCGHGESVSVKHGVAQFDDQKVEFVVPEGKTAATAIKFTSPKKEAPKAKPKRSRK
jgi:hypothetical protein